MIILPAIDLIDGKPVRLYKGDFSTAQQVAKNALETAKNFESAGAEWVHIVDLDGALKKERVNSDTVLEIAENTNLKIEVGGGIRTMEDIEFYASKGISRVILGSVAQQNPMFVKEAVKEFGSIIAVGIDAKDGFVATEGWTEKSTTNYLDLARYVDNMGVENIIYTDISRDGMLSGPNLEQLSRLNYDLNCNITASGGVTNLGDIITLRDAGLYGVICGRSIYHGTLNLKEAVDVCK
ncbi:MAG: 1-(5-phosphoribosyl)-5-[Eubacterium sp.]|nr:1-(5-phosphoribosyl)-5-[(5-phosphoribosylamino)methylideneamino]imidazole-4-carboxamide isomerase [Eubacterium sp.]MBR7072422.1 1-(5-phosphoribosyl)-5-[(5-phosphoribosylamino)methylideneamino]imidazole-4-carboxamide isomerase [Eubacterium sp.]